MRIVVRHGPGIGEVDGWEEQWSVYRTERQASPHGTDSSTIPMKWNVLAMQWMHWNGYIGMHGMMEWMECIESNVCMQCNGCIDQGPPPWVWHGGLPPQVPLVSDTTPSLKNILVQQESFFSTCPDHWVDL